MPERTCCGCRKIFDKKDLIRIVKKADGTIALDPEAVSDGRGAYICKDPACFSKAKKAKSIERSLHAASDARIYDLLEQEIMSVDR